MWYQDNRTGRRMAGNKIKEAGDINGNYFLQQRNNRGIYS